MFDECRDLDHVIRLEPLEWFSEDCFSEESFDDRRAPVTKESVSKWHARRFYTEFHVMGRVAKQVTVQEVRAKWPADWKEAIKERLFRYQWMAWAKNRWPVRYQSIHRPSETLKARELYLDVPATGREVRLVLSGGIASPDGAILRPQDCKEIVDALYQRRGLRGELMDVLRAGYDEFA